MAALALLAVYLPFVVKRAALLGTPGVIEWLAWDYGVRMVSLAGVFACSRACLLDELHARVSARKVIPAFAFGLLFLYVMDAFVFPVLTQNLPYLHLFEPPIIGNAALLLFDLTIGLMLVAVSEELAYRRVAFSVLRKLGLGETSIVFLSSMAFALAHLTSGIGSVLNVFLIGLMLGTVFSVTRRLSPCILLHYFDHALGFGQRIAAASVGSAG